MPRSYSRAVRRAKKFFCNMPRACGSCGAWRHGHRGPIDAVAAAGGRRERQSAGEARRGHETVARDETVIAQRQPAKAVVDVRIDAGLVEDEVGAGASRKRGNSSARTAR